MKRLSQLSPVLVVTLMAANSYSGTPATGPSIDLNAPSCLVAGRFPQLEAVVTPSSSTAKARLMFRAGLSTEWLSVDMVPGIGNYLGTMTRPSLTASPVTFFLEVSGPGFGPSRSAEYQAIVVEREEDCAGRKVARMVSFGPLSAQKATGGRVLRGFAGDVAGGFLGLSTTSSVIAASGAPVPTTVGIGGRNTSPIH